MFMLLKPAFSLSLSGTKIIIPKKILKAKEKGDWQAPEQKKIFQVFLTENTDICCSSS